MLAGKRRGDRAAEGMRDDDGLFHTEAVHQRGDRIGLRGQRFVVATSRPAEARAVEEQHFGAALERRLQRQHLVLEVGAGAVDEDDWRQAGAGGRRDMDVMDARAVDLGELADRRTAPLDQPDPGAGDTGQGKEERDDEKERGADEVHVVKIRRREAIWFSGWMIFDNLPAIWQPESIAPLVRYRKRSRSAGKPQTLLIASSD
jgi:hypothetical protein